ncbi:MAG: hypothetical protein HZA46_00865 [Planctomycetales bacterium]|nr:hypothetical protein [Planctomycetales bacterium]
MKPLRGKLAQTILAWDNGTDRKRRDPLDAIVLPGESEVLLGFIPREDMDLVIDPKSQTVQVNPTMPYISKKPMKYSR